MEERDPLKRSVYELEGIRVFRKQPYPEDLIQNIKSITPSEIESKVKQRKRPELVDRSREKQSVAEIEDLTDRNKKLMELSEDMSKVLKKVRGER